MAQDQMVQWCTLFLTVVGKDPPEHSLGEDLDEREKSHFWKAKKWAYANLNRLFIRYVRSRICPEAATTKHFKDTEIRVQTKRTRQQKR